MPWALSFPIFSIPLHQFRESAFAQKWNPFSYSCIASKRKTQDYLPPTIRSPKNRQILNTAMTILALVRPKN